jgi:hypothetical protein
MQMPRSKWVFPLFAGGLGVLMLGAEAIAGHPRRGLESLGIFVILALVILAGGRSETVRGLRGDGSDERFEMIGLRAGAFAGLVLTLTLAGGVLWRVAEGRDTGLFGWLALLAGGCYLTAFLYQRLRI